MVESRGRDPVSRLAGRKVPRPWPRHRRRGAAFRRRREGKLSELAKSVHTLWMSATPIPRTLAAGLAGFRDLSVIASPPVHRLPVATKIAPLSDAAIATALLREQRRHGQSFLICPRIQDLDPMLARVQSMAPDLRIVCLHGKLSGDEIDDRMMRFVEGEADVLLATNIVETELDIPRANTIVVCWPEKFGLSQLHQLRGRVGRSGIRAFAYLLTDTDSKRSEQRLAVLEEFSRPGAGFAISARDLDLRGAGDLFSEQQSGHVQVFGPVLYSHLLKSASEKSDDRATDLWVPDLNLPVADMLPADYAQSEAVRLEIYGRAARCGIADELDDLEEEISRRFGKLPPAARDFLPLRGSGLTANEGGSYDLTSGRTPSPRPSCQGVFGNPGHDRCNAMATASSMPARNGKIHLVGWKSFSTC